MRLVYLGTPACSAACLRTLAGAGIPVAAVVTQPDRAKGRFRTPTPPPVKVAARDLGIPVHQPEKASAPEFVETLRTVQPDVVAVFAFGEILSDEFLGVARLGTVNLHLSYLPAHRGAAPVQWALIHGEKETGASVIHLSSRLDAGDIICQEREPIAEDDTAEMLEARLTRIGSRLLVQAVRDLEAGTAQRVPQDESRATKAPKLRKEDGRIDWTKPARVIRNLIRAVTPWPGAQATLQLRGQPMSVRIVEAHVVAGQGGGPGVVVSVRPALHVATGEGTLEIALLQPEGRRPMSAEAFLAGHHLEIGAHFG